MKGRTQNLEMELLSLTSRIKLEWPNSVKTAQLFARIGINLNEVPLVSTSWIGWGQLLIEELISGLTNLGG